MYCESNVLPEIAAGQANQRTVRWQADRFSGAGKMRVGNQHAAGMIITPVRGGEIESVCADNYNKNQ